MALRWTDHRLAPDGRDAALAFSLLIVTLLSGLYTDPARPDTVHPGTVWHWALIFTPPFLVAYRVRRPVVVVGLVTVAQVAIWVTNLPAVLLGVFIILYTAASASEPSTSRVTGFKASVVSSVILTIFTGIGVRVAEDVTIYQLPLVALTCATAITLGVNAKRQRELAAEFAETAALTRLHAENERSQAIADERSHIARELHDIVGHVLSVIAVRAESADRVAASQPDVSRQAVSEIAVVARSALDDTRRVLAGLREASAAELRPPPDLDATVQLVEQLAATGIDATLQSNGCCQEQPSAVVAGGVYRIVQESLTNAIKHAGANTTINAVIACQAQSVEVLVTNTMKGVSGEDAEVSGGSGVAGMAERVDVLGGTFSAGPRPDGLFAVHAIIPNREVAKAGRRR